MIIARHNWQWKWLRMQISCVDVTLLLLLLLVVSMAVEGSAIAFCNNTSILNKPLLLQFYYYLNNSITLIRAMYIEKESIYLIPLRTLKFGIYWLLHKLMKNQKK
jgi:hypothetical protein